MDPNRGFLAFKPVPRLLRKLLLALLMAWVALLFTPKTARAQTSEGNTDKDGVAVPVFAVPGGSASINNSGEATIAIPLAVPPGVRGMAPSLSLNYSSGAGESGLGTGWTLSLGYPDAIVRSTRFGVPDFSEYDLFTYDGQDLVRMGTSLRFRTLIESFELIRVNTLTRPYGTWTVTRRDGTQLIYGQGEGERSYVPGKGTIAWHLSRVIDADGNTIQFIYEGPADALRLKAIRFTQDKDNNFAAIGQLQEVVLTWSEAGERPDPRWEASYGAMVLHDRRLDKIQTYSDSRLVSTYDLLYADEEHGLRSAYDATLKGNSLLVGLREIGGEGPTEVSLPTRKFLYQQRSAGWVYDPGATDGDPNLIRTPRGEFFVFHEPWNPDDLEDERMVDQGLRAIDVNGDGLVDLVHAREENPARPPQVYLHNGARWAPDTAWTNALRATGLYFVKRDPDAGVYDLGARLLDVNGDGLPDFVVSRTGDLGNAYEVRLNHGQGWCAPNQTPTGPGVCAAGGYTLPTTGTILDLFFVEVNTTEHTSMDLGVRFAELNGDGLPDLIRSAGKYPNLGEIPDFVYLNNGSSGWGPNPVSWTIPVDFVDVLLNYPFSIDLGVRLADVNQDGLDDILHAQKRGAQDPDTDIYLNKGAGWEAPDRWSLPQGFYFSQWMGDDHGAQLVDLDGDGYLDILSPDGPTETLVYFNNQSDGFVPATWTLTDVPESLVFPFNDILSDYGTRVVDVNGDGLADLLHADGDGPGRRTHLANPSLSDLVVHYTNPLGGTTAFGYGRADGRATPAGQMPFARTVALSIRQDAGMGDPAVTSTYSYQRGYYDWRNRDFLGFAIVKETRPDRTWSERQFYVERGAKGYLKVETLNDVADKPWRKEAFTYSIDSLNGVYQTLLESDEVVQYHTLNQNESVTRKTTYLYETTYGNLLEVREWGFDGTVERSKRITYTYPNTSLWIVGLPCAIERYAKDFEKLLVTEQFYHDRHGEDSHCFPPNQGRLTMRILFDQRLESKTLASGSSTIYTRYDHDGYGNVTLETDGRGYSTHVDFSGNGYLFPHTTTQDNPGGAAMKKVTEYDRALGVLVKVIGLNGDPETTRYEYDKLGRMKAIYYPGDPVGLPSVEVESYSLASSPAYMQVLARLDSRGIRRTYQYFDGLGRPLGTSTSSCFGAVDGENCWILSGLTRYNNRGWQSRSYEPFFRSSSAFTNSPQGGGTATSFEYDDDKLYKTTYSDGSFTVDLFTAQGINSTGPRFAADPQIVTYREFDAFGQLAKVITDTAGAAPTRGETNYEYDALGGLAKITDPNGLVTTLFYDARGLLRGLTAPDGMEGTRNTFQIWNDYDENGNQTYHWAGLDVWKAEFDPLDRQTKIFLSSDGGKTWSLEPEKVSIYDEGGAAANALGRLTTIEGHGVVDTTIKRSYNVSGWITQEQFLYRALDASLPETVTVGYDYDPREGLLMGLDDPQGNLIQYSRNALGQIDKTNGFAISYEGFSWPNVIDDFVYDAAGRVKTITFNDLVYDEFYYDGLGRMQYIKGSGPLAGSEYRYYGSGDLSYALERGASIDYTYDNLHRLQTADGAIGQTPLDLTFDYYDAMGNLHSVTGDGAADVSYHYAQGSNRLASYTLDGSDYSVTPDQHGNSAQFEYGDQVRIYSYDALSRLTTYADTAGRSTSFVYDGLGRKVRRQVAEGGTEVYFYTPQGQTLATYRGGVWTTYLSADGMRVAYVSQGTFYRVHGDRLGSTRAITAEHTATPTSTSTTPVILGWSTPTPSATPFPSETQTSFASLTPSSTTEWTPTPTHTGEGTGSETPTSSAGAMPTPTPTSSDAAQDAGAAPTAPDAQQPTLTTEPPTPTATMASSVEPTGTPEAGALDLPKTPTGTPPDPTPAYRLVWQGDYLPFGLQINESGTGDNFRFTGQELDDVLDIYDYGARYYDPILRRFLQVDGYMGDPANPASLNRYVYANNNPLKYTDPTGHCGVGVGPNGETVCPPEINGQPMYIGSQAGAQQKTPMSTEIVIPEIRGVNVGLPALSLIPSPNLQQDPLAELTVYAPRELPPGAYWTGSEVRYRGIDPSEELNTRWNTKTGDWEFANWGMALIGALRGFSARDLAFSWNEPSIYATRPPSWPDMPAPANPDDPLIYNATNIYMPMSLSGYGYKAPGPAFNYGPGLGPGWLQGRTQPTGVPYSPVLRPVR
ncbi:MAG TPA: RHS repeat-associated core domain-containing protein [Anaerolineales bacterium]|nr:RHS repeat-associated core domain-containing protein [Anaerolineales bacterium]